MSNQLLLQKNFFSLSKKKKLVCTGIFKSLIQPFSETCGLKRKKVPLKFLRLQSKGGVRLTLTLFERRKLCLQKKKKFESIFVAQQTEYFSTVMMLDESRNVENRLQCWSRNVRVRKVCAGCFFLLFFLQNAKSLALELGCDFNI